MEKRLKNLRVQKRLEKAFNWILVAFVFAIAFGLAGVAMINANVERFYGESYKNTELQLEIQRDIQMLDKYVLWAVTSADGEQQSKLTEADTYAQRVEENVLALTESFSDKDMTAALGTAWEKLKTEKTGVTDLAVAGKSEEALAEFNGSYSEVASSIQEMLTQIGDSANAQAATAYGRATSLVKMIVFILVVVGIVSGILCRNLSKIITRLMLKPINELQNVTNKLKAGELNIEIAYNNEDEFGELAQNFQEACAKIRVVIEDMDYLLREMARGNFNIDSHMDSSYVGDFEVLIVSIRQMNQDLSNTLRQINQTSSQVMEGSEQLAGSAQSLAAGATEQAGAVQELTATIADVANIAEGSAQGSERAATTAKESAENAEKSKEEINALTEAMERINVTSKEIENIIAAIEDIASQTNLLSLNASIEAARAGEAGKGFAVVADQIGKLATDSAKSAVTTRELISKSLEEIENGSRIVEQTMKMIASVLESMEQFANMASDTAVSSKQQATMLKQIEAGIEQISSVVESNSSSAEETSAISEELSAQAQSLEQMVSAFELRRG